MRISGALNACARGRQTGANEPNERTCGRLQTSLAVEQRRRGEFSSPLRSPAPLKPSCTPDLATATPPASIYIPRRLAIAQSDSPAGKQAAVCGDIGLKSNHSSAQSQYCFSHWFPFLFSPSIALFCMHVRERRWDGEYWERHLTALAAHSWVVFFFSFFFIWVN